MKRFTRFGMRTIVVLFTLTALAGGWIRWQLAQAESDREAMANLARQVTKTLTV